MAKYKIEFAVVDPDKETVHIPATARIVGFAPWDSRTIAYLIEVDK